MTDFTLKSVIPGNFSGVRADFTFKRSYSYFLSHMYGTSFVIVVISWLGFVVPLEETAARIALGITSLLTEVTILNMMNNSMPKVSKIIQLNLIASWFTSYDLETGHFVVTAVLFTNDFPRSLNKFVLEYICSNTFKMSKKCASPVYILVLRKEENCLQQLIAPTTKINCNFSGTKTYL